MATGDLFDFSLTKLRGSLLRAGRFDLRLNFFAQRLGGVDAIFPAHVTMCHDANRIRPERTRQHAARFQPRRQFGRALPRRATGR